MELNDDQTEVLVEFEPQLLVADDTASEALATTVFEMLVDENGAQEMLVLEPSTELLVEESDESNQILETSPQGPPGPPGPMGGVLETDPQFTYDVEGRLSRVDYASGNYKTFTYVTGRLQLIANHIGPLTLTREFVYDANGRLTNIIG